MSDDNNLSGKVGLDTTDFKTGVAALNREIRVVESGFRASAAALDDWANDASGLEQRIQTLNRTIDLQKQKVAATRQEYERIKAEKGETSRAAQDLAIRLNKETETLNEMSKELTTTEGKLSDLTTESDDAADSVDDLGEKTEESAGKMGGFKSALSGIVGTAKLSAAAIAGLVAIVTALVGLIGGLVFSTASASAELVDLAAKTGISTTRLQELAYVGDQVGTGAETMTSAMARLTRSMSDATQQSGDFAAKQADANEKVTEARIAYDKAVSTYGKGSEKAESALKRLEDAQESLAELTNGDVAAAFAKLGVSVTDANGNLRDNEAVFTDVIRQLGTISNETERDALAMAIFGKSAQELNPLIKAGAGELARLSQEAHEVGAVMSEEDVAAFEAFDDTLASLQAGLKGTLGTLAGAFLPGFQTVFDQAGGYLKEFAAIVKGSDGDLGKMTSGVVALVQKIIQDVSQQAPALLKAGLDIVLNIVKAIITALPTLLPAAVEILLTLVTFLVENLPLIIDAAIQMVLALANGLTSALPTLIPAIVTAIVTIVEALIDNLPLLIDAALQLIQALAEGLIAALPLLLKAVPVIYDKLLDAIFKLLPLLLKAGIKLLGTLVLGILQALPELTKAAWGLIGTFAEHVGQAISELIPSLGQAILDGFKEGVADNWDSFVGYFTNLFQQLWNTISSIFTQGLGGTAQDALNELAGASRFGAASNRLSTGGALGAGSGQAMINEHYHFIGSTVNINGKTGERISRQIRGRPY